MKLSIWGPSATWTRLLGLGFVLLLLVGVLSLWLSLDLMGRAHALPTRAEPVAAPVLPGLPPLSVAEGVLVPADADPSETDNHPPSF